MFNFLSKMVGNNSSDVVEPRKVKKRLNSSSNSLKKSNNISGNKTVKKKKPIVNDSVDNNVFIDKNDSKDTYFQKEDNNNKNEKENKKDIFEIPEYSSQSLVKTSRNNIKSNQNGFNTGITAKLPSESELEEINDYSGRVLTYDEIKISKSAKVECALLENGWFVYNKDDRHNATIGSTRQTIQRSNHKIVKELLISMPAIRGLYENHERLYAQTGSVRNLDMINGQESQEFQREFLGLIEDAYKKNVSDIHIYVRQHETELAFRINSELDRFNHKTNSWGHTLCRAAHTMAGEADAQYLVNKYQGARISRDFMPNLPKGVQSIRLQFSPLPGGGRYLVCRILKEGTKETKTISDLGYQKIHVDTINQMRRQSEGITIIAGPTGSGKSTTLVVMITSDMADNPGKNIITVEDPPEYIILNAAQFAVMNTKDEAGKREAFNDALGSALRSDPDTVMIGEIRDASSAGLAFKAALTGHRVYASLHANNAIAIMNRLRDIGVEVYNLTEPSLVAGLIGQRLIRYVCKHCRIPFKKGTDEILTKAGLNQKIIIDKINEIDEMAKGRETYDGIYLTNEEGCSHCRKGISGRATVAETIAPDEDFMELIRADKTSDAINLWLNKYDGLTMQEHALQKMTKGVSSPQDVLDVTGDFTKFNVKERGDKVFGDLYIDAK